MKSALLCWSLAVAAVAQEPRLTHGPFRGHVDTEAMHVWARAEGPGAFTLQLTSLADGALTIATAVAAAEHDFVLHFTANGLTAAQAFSLRILQGEQEVFTGGPWLTALPDDASTATIAFGSCSSDKGFVEQPIWGRILARAPQALVLLGDTPYIDLGTVEARRRRHREFFAFAPVRATLQSVPTWTTWDDHDYTANDEFGAVKGSETARPVFVDYHAHAGYGDGERGIYTRFRQGPIEVFVLDARTFADTEPSVLAPGERTLLGKAQTQWLQQGLRNSTATFRVLACGMVWNDGVRPSKKDCWGNWLPERDALFRWLGEQRIGGVVLVSGDVHRSRVILHPTKALAGYDIPEFVTSPLAQNVLESNKVDVPGLVFDAGEAHSCLFLGATRAANDDDSMLRAVFQAGDGREFHVRELLRASLQRANAAVHYRRAVALMKAAFGDEYDRLPTSDVANEKIEAQVEDMVAAPWRAAVKVAEPALAEWLVAVSIDRCWFREPAKNDFNSEFLADLLRGLLGLQQVVKARCLQAVADGDMQVAADSIAALLAYASHLQQGTSTLPWAIAAEIEQQCASLHSWLRQRAPVGVGAAAVESSRAAIARHLGTRPGLAAVGVVARNEVFRSFEVSLRMLAGGKDRKAVFARELGVDVRRHFVTLLDPLFATCDAIGESLTPEVAAQLAVRTGELVARRAARSKALKALGDKAADGAADVDAAADLALLLATMLVPNLDGLLTEIDAAHRTLVAAAK